MTIPDYQSLMLPVLIASSKGEVQIGPVVEELANQLGLTPEERSALLPSGKQTVIANRVNWAKSYLKQAGLVENTRRGQAQVQSTSPGCGHRCRLAHGRSAKVHRRWSALAL